MAEFKINEEMGAADNDRNILDLCKKLTKKNYITKASCEGHPEDLYFVIDEGDILIVQSPEKGDIAVGMYDPYILFNKKYEFKSLPKYWRVDNNAIRVTFPGMSNVMIKVRKATDEEIKKFTKDYYSIKELSDSDKIIQKMKDFKKSYMTSLKQWIDSLPTLNDSINESIEVLTENLILNKKDLCVNIDKFENGEKNVMLITGFSGSGKSTLASELAKKYNCDYFELDSLSHYLAKNMTIDNVKNGEPALYDYIEKHNLKQEIPSNNEYNDLYRSYIKFIINWCKNKTGKKFIIEGLQLYEIYQEGDSFITSCPMIIKGTSGLISAIRAGKRNEGSFLKEFGPLIKWAIKDNKSLEKLKNDMNNLNETVEILDETKSTIDKDFKPKGKLSLSSFKKIHIDENVIKRYEKDYPILKHVRCKDTNEYICDGYMWLDNEKLVCVVGSCEYLDNHDKYIVSLEIMDEYKGYGLSKQIVSFAVNEMKCDKLSVNKNNEVTKKVYDDFGFKVFHEDKNMYYMSLNKSSNLNETIESLNEASSSSNSSKRKEITDLIVKMFDALEKGGTKNSDKFLNQTKKMSDTQFIAYMTSLVNDPKKHLYFEIEAFENEPDYETVERVANEIVGEEYTKLYDYIAFPHLSDDPDKPVYTIHKVFNGYINMRRVQQLVNNKNHIPTHISKRDPKTNQVVFESKAARVADVEQFALICHGTKNVLKEFFGPRGGDAVMRDEMSKQIATTGSAQLSDMHDSKLNKTSLNTANVYLLAAGIESDMVTKNGILPRTIMKQYQDAKGLDRTNVR